ncbi:hypothetical protein [Arcanobacterium canis]
MSVMQDRSQIKAAIEVALPDFRVFRCPPPVLKEKTAFLELENVAPASTYGAWEITWTVTIITAPWKSEEQATDELDNAVYLAMTGLVESDAAIPESVAPYFALTEQSTGGTYPAVKITAKSLIQQ